MFLCIKSTIYGPHLDSTAVVVIHPRIVPLISKSVSVSIRRYNYACTEAVTYQLTFICTFDYKCMPSVGWLAERLLSVPWTPGKSLEGHHNAGLFFDGAIIVHKKDRCFHDRVVDGIRRPIFRPDRRVCNDWTNVRRTRCAIRWSTI